MITELIKKYPHLHEPSAIVDIGSFEQFLDLPLKYTYFGITIETEFPFTKIYFKKGLSLIGIGILGYKTNPADYYNDTHAYEVFLNNKEIDHKKEIETLEEDLIPQLAEENVITIYCKDLAVWNYLINIVWFPIEEEKNKWEHLVDIMERFRTGQL